MARTIILKKGDMKKEAYVGFSWTTFFFGFLVPLFRGDFKGAFFMFIITSFNCFLALFTFGIGAIIVNIIVAKSYNKYYTEGLLNNGFVPASENDKDILKMYNYC